MNTEPTNPHVEEIRQNVHLLTFTGGKTLYLIGTAHISADSVKLVEEIITETKPDTICVELDEKRYRSMIDANSYKNIDIFQIIKEKQIFFFIGQFVIASYQKKLSEKTGSKPGLEFKRAIELSDEMGARLVLADRNIGITLKRAFRLTPFKHKMNLLASLFFSDDKEIENLDIEKMKEQDAIENIVNSFADELPVTKKVLIDERDEYLASEIYENMGKTTVAVVGAGHVSGILKQISNPPDPERKKALELVPNSSRIVKLLPWLIPTVVAALIIWGFASGNKNAAKDAIFYWIMINGTLAALGCIIAAAHPLTVLAGFIAAPITSLNPAIGVGFVTAIVQAFLVKPRVIDMEEIRDRSLPWKKWWSNRLTRVFLVFLCSSIGSSIGTFVALPILTKIF